MGDIAEHISGRTRSFGRQSEGRLVDLNTGTLRRDHVLVQQTPGADLFIGLGPVAARALDFAFGDEAETDDYSAKALPSDALDRLAAVEDRHLRRLVLLDLLIAKASPDDPDHPGWPAGTPGAVGGQFRPKNGTAQAKESTAQRIKRLAAREKFRIYAVAFLRAAATVVLNFVPGVDVAVDFSELASLGATAIELGNSEAQVKAALEFVKTGPYTFDELQASPNDESFSSFDAFKKIAPAIEAFLKRFGPARAGSEYHHLVEQGGANAKNIPAELLQSTRNIAEIPKLLHEEVNADYSRTSDEDETKTVREWLQTQPFEVQYKYGIETLKKLGILKN